MQITLMLPLAEILSIQTGTNYTPGTNTTILNGSSNQTFTVNLASALSLNKFTIDKPAGVSY